MSCTLEISFSRKKMELAGIFLVSRFAAEHASLDGRSGG